MGASNFSTPETTNLIYAYIPEVNHTTERIQSIAIRIEKEIQQELKNRYGHYETISVNETYQHRRREDQHNLFSVRWEMYRHGIRCYEVEFTVYKEYGYYEGVRFDYSQKVTENYTDIPDQEVLERKQANHIRRAINKVLEKHTHNKLRRVGTFSNGNTVYEEA